MRRLHIVGGKNHGKTTLVVELVEGLNRLGTSVGTIKHTHHQHELDVPGKDSYRHRTAGAKAVGILSPSMTAVFLPSEETSPAGEDRYAQLAPMFDHCSLVLVEGDSKTCAPKIEVWRSELGTPPLAIEDPTILAVVTDDKVPGEIFALSRSNIAGLAQWILSNTHCTTARD